MITDLGVRVRLRWRAAPVIGARCHEFAGKIRGPQAEMVTDHRRRAIFAMLAPKQGGLSFDTNFEPTERPITGSTEALLIEEWRIDEAGIT